MSHRLKAKIKPMWIVMSERWGSATEIAFADIEELCKEQISISLLCIQNSPTHAAALRLKSLYPTLNVHTFASVPSGLSGSLIFIRRLRQVLKETKSTIIHLHGENFLAKATIALMGFPFVSLVVNKYNFTEPGMFKQIRSVFLPRLDYLIVLSETIKQSLLKSYAVREKKIKIISLGLDFSDLDPTKAKGLSLRETWGADKDTVIIGNVARFSEDSGQDIFIKAAAGLLKDSERKMKFVLVDLDPVASNAEYVETLKKLVERFKLGSSISFHTLDDSLKLQDVISSMDIFVMPGNEDVPGLGAIEAMAMERPVILSNVMGAFEIVGGGEFGMLVRPLDAFDLQQKTLILLDNPSTRLSMGTEARKYVIRYFDKKIRNHRILDVYEKCIKRRYAKQERLSTK